MTAANEGRAPGARDKAIKFLQNELAVGPRAAKELTEMAEANDSTLSVFGCEVRIIPFRDIPEKKDVSDSADVVDVLAALRIVILWRVDVRRRRKPSYPRCAAAHS